MKKPSQYELDTHNTQIAFTLILTLVIILFMMLQIAIIRPEIVGGNINLFSNLVFIISIIALISISISYYLWIKRWKPKEKRR